MIKASDLPPELRARMGIPAESKYKVKAKDTRTADGIVFDSKAEMHRYRELLRLREQGLVQYFLRQIPFHLPGGVKYVCDFMVVWNNGRIVYEDVKGVRTDLFIAKKKIVEAIYPVTIHEISRKARK